MRRIVIIGGGITGLAAAFALKQRVDHGEPLTYTVLEESQWVGGKVATERIDGFLIEGGPDSFLAQKPAALELCRALGLEDQLVGVREGAGASILRHGRLHPIPPGMALLAPADRDAFLASTLFSDEEKARILAEESIPPGGEDGDESLASFVRRRLGDAALEVLAEPLYAGVHVADGERLSMAAALPRFRALERQYGSLSAAARALLPATAQPSPSRAPAFLTLKDGMGTLVEELRRRLEGHLRLGARVQEVTPSPSGEPPLTVRLENGEKLLADAVLITTPPPATAALVAEWQPLLAARLRSLRMTSSATISLAYRRESVGHALEGTGFVVPRGESPYLLACTWASSKFPGRVPAGMALLRAVVGGARAPEVSERSEKDLIDLAQRELKDLLGLSAAPVLARVFRWRNVHPQYDVGHLDWVQAVEEACPPQVCLAGAAYRGIGVPDCIAQGQAAATAICEHLSESGVAGSLTA